jgi:hypothetical protein
MAKRERKKSEKIVGPRDLQGLAIEGGTATIAALVGFAVGGPAGAVVGAATPPLVMRAVVVSKRFYDRRHDRAIHITQQALVEARMTEEQLVDRLEVEPELTDILFNLIRTAADSDPALDSVFSALAGAVLSDPLESTRVAVLADTIKDLLPVHIRVLSSLREGNGTRLAAEISIDVGVPEVELRGVVRSLEARGMIKDITHEPMTWSLRELGKAVADYVA